MKVEQLLCLLAIKRYMSFTQAAESLYMTQSGLSKQIKALENELGVQLFERSHSALRLTPACEQVCIHAEMMVNEYGHMCLAAKRFNYGNQKLRVASLYEMAQYGVVDLIVAFEQGKTGFHVESVECEHKHMLDLLETNQTDIIIGYQEFWPRMSRCNCIPLRSDRLVLIVDRRHKFADRESVKLEEAREERFCFPQEDTSLFEYLKHSCITAGFVPLLTRSDVRLGTIRHYIRAGMRVTLQPGFRALSSFSEPEFRIIPLHDAQTLTLSMLADTERLPEIGSQFLDFARIFYDDLTPK